MPSRDLEMLDVDSIERDRVDRFSLKITMRIYYIYLPMVSCRCIFIHIVALATEICIIEHNFFLFFFLFLEKYLNVKSLPAC